MCNIFLHDEFSLDFFSSLSTNEENWIRYFNNFYMPTLLTKTKWVKNANIAFCFNAKMGNNISNYLTSKGCLEKKCDNIGKHLEQHIEHHTYSINISYYYDISTWL